MSCITWCKRTNQFPDKDAVDFDFVDWKVSMSSFTTYFTDKILNHVFGGDSYTPPTGLWLACHSTGSANSIVGEELSGSGYSRTPFSLVKNTRREWNNEDLIIGPTPSADWEEILSLTIFDSETGGNAIAWGNVNSGVKVKANNPYIIVKGDLTVGIP